MRRKVTGTKEGKWCGGALGWIPRSSWETRRRGYESRVNNEGMVSVTKMGGNVPVAAFEGVKMR